MKFNHPYLDRVVELDLPEPYNVVINCGAAMVIRGYREPRPDGDIDAGISLRNMRHCRRRGFEIVRRTVGHAIDGTPREIVSSQDSDKQFDFHRWGFCWQCYNDTGHGRIYLDRMKTMSDQDEKTGIYVARKELIVAMKQGTGREKDESDLTILGDNHEHYCNLL